MTAQELPQPPKLLEDVTVSFPSMPINMDLVFSLHGAPRDLPQEFTELVGEADIVALEAVKWTTEGKDLCQSVANGDNEALKSLSAVLPLDPSGGFWRKIHKSIFNTGVNIHYPDAPWNHPVAEAFTETLEDVQYFRPGLSSMLKHFKSIRDRDAYILEHLFPEELPETDSALKYVALFGLVHRGLTRAISHQAFIQGRNDITINTILSGSVNDQAYQKFIEGEKITPEVANDYRIV